MHVPKNVLWFEVLLYSSLTLDALSVAFQDRTPTAELTERTIFVMTVMDLADPALGVSGLARRTAAQELAALGAGRSSGAFRRVFAGDYRRHRAEA